MQAGRSHRMNVWALDFDAHEIEEIEPAALADARASGRFCWVDAPGSELESVREYLGLRRIPDGFERDALHELIIDEDWVAFGLSEPQAEEQPARGANLLFTAELLVTCDFGVSETLSRLRLTWREDFRRFARSPGFLLFEFGDHYINVAQVHLHTLEDHIEDLQRHLFGDADDSIFGETAESMQALYDFRREIMGVQETFEELSTRSSPFIPESTQPFLARCAVRLERMANELLLQRDGLMSGLNLYIGMNGHWTSLLLKRLTIVSMVFLPLSFLAGVFGMNFKYFPGLGFQHGIALFWVVCGAITLTLLIVARRARWF